MVTPSCSDYSAQLLQPQRQSFKQQQKRKRGLSAFYFSKSQSFNCMRDLQKNNPFLGSSAILLAKPAAQTPPGWQQQFGSIQEDMCELDMCVPQDNSPTVACTQVPEAASLARRSWDGSLPPVVLAAPTPAADAHQQQQQGALSSCQAGGSGCALPCAGGGVTSRCVSLNASLSSSSNSYSSSMEACDPCVDGAGDICSSQHPSTDNLCLALHAASLQQAPQLVSPCGNWS